MIWIGSVSAGREITEKWIASVHRWLGHTMGRKYVYHDSSVMLCVFLNGRPKSASLIHPVILDGWMKIPRRGVLFRGEEIDTNDWALLYECVQDSSIVRDAIGEFGIVYWACDRLEVITDRYVAQPIYYWEDQCSKALFLSNDLRALFHNEHVPFEVDGDACRLYGSARLAWMDTTIGNDKTYFKYIRKVKPATKFVWNGSISQAKYWTVGDIARYELLKEDASPIVREVIEDAVADRLTLGTKVMEVSGGLDSTTLLGAAGAKGVVDNLVAVNVSFKDPDLAASHDLMIVKRLWKDFGIKGIIVWGDSLVSYEEPILRNIDGPGSDLSPYGQVLEAIAEEHGSTYVFSGDGGDYLFAGNVCVIDHMLRRGEFARAARTLWEWSGRDFSETFRLGIKYGIAPFLPLIGEYMYRKRELGWDEAEEVPSYYTVEQLAFEKRVWKNRRLELAESKPLKSWGRRHQYDWLFPRSDYLDDRGSTFRYTYPYYDQRVLDVAFRIPPDQLYDVVVGRPHYHLGSKRVLRSAFRDVLPDYVIERKTKTNYGQMGRKELAHNKKYLLDLVNGGKNLYIAEFGIVDGALFWKHLVATLSRVNDPDYTPGKQYRHLVNLLLLERWLREMKQGRDAVLSKARPGRLRVKGEIERVG